MAAAQKAPRKRASRSAISPQELLHEFPGAKVVTFEANTMMFSEKSRTGNCYLLMEGKARILKRSRDGNDIPLAFVKAGEFLGEMAMLSGEKRSASALAVTEVKAIAIGHTEFVALLKKRHPFAIRLALQLSTLLATRCHHLLHLIARQPGVIPHPTKKTPPFDARAVINRVYTLWAI